MNNFFYFLVFLLLSSQISAQSVTIDPRATTNGSAIIKAQSTTAGTLIPNMTSSQRTLIAVPPKGLLVFDTDTGTFWFHNGTDWVQLVGGTSYWTPTNGASNLLSSYPTFTLGGGTNTAGLVSGAGSDGTLRVFSPGSITANRYLNLDGISIQARRANDLTGVKTENNLLLNPFGGNVGIGLGSIAPTAKFHLGGDMKIDGSNILEFGAGVSGKNINAGKIGYQAFGNADALDIVGAGATSNRKIKLWAESGTTLSGGLYSDQTGNLNIVPLGVIRYEVTNLYDGTPNDGRFSNLAGNICISADYFASSNLTTADEVGLKLNLDPSIYSQYRKLIAVGTPSFFGTNNVFQASSTIIGYIQTFGYSDSSYSYDPSDYQYSTLTIKVRADDFPILDFIELNGTVMIYGIK